MIQPLDISRLLVLRKVTRAISELLGQELKAYLSTLAPLLQPRSVFGQCFRGSEKQSVKGDAEAFDELRRLYMALAAEGPWSLPKQLDPPLDVLQTSLELHPADYAYAAQGTQESKTVLVTSPLKWILAFSGFEPKRLRELTGSRKTVTGNDVQQCVLQFLVVHVTLAKRPGIVRLLEGLRFPISTGRIAEFGELPITYANSPISAFRPPDDLIIQSTEMSGMPVFEEVANLEDPANVRDPLKDRLLQLVTSYGEQLWPK
jgi:hypothetical protein